MKISLRWPSWTTGTGEDPALALAPDEAPNLKKATISGVRWVAVSQLVAQVGSLGASVVMARILTPAEFGEAAIAIVLLPLSILLSFAGFGAALVQFPEIDARLVRSAGTMSILFGAAQTAAVFLLAPVVAQPLFGDATSDLIQLISPVFLLGGLAVVPRALLQRQLKFRRLSVIEMAGFTGGTAVALAAAIAGAGARSLVFGALATAAVSRLLMVSSAPILKPGWSSSGNWKIVRFGVPASLTSVAFWARQNADYAIIGATLGSAATGLYWRAFQWGVGYQNQVAGIMTQVAFPVLSRSAGNDHLLELRGRMTRVTNVMLLPMLGVVIATAPVLIPWLFGSRWTGAVVPTQLLAVAGMASCATSNHIPVMLAAGHPRPVMIMQVVSLFALIAVCLAAVPFGVTGVCGAMALLFIVMLFAIYHFLLCGVLGLPRSVLRADLLPAALPTAFLLAVAYPVTEILRGLQVPAFPLLLVVSLVGASVYTLALWSMFPDAFGDAKQLFERVMPGRARNMARILPWNWTSQSPTADSLTDVLSKDSQ